MTPEILKYILLGAVPATAVTLFVVLTFWDDYDF